ncbi:MAG TPA: gamma-glutamyltransferase [Thermoanaerobaculia bacterium]|jgi:gamma-glutamyltranspeptidase/glutathione hydrolase|nr:gamma-glutamyltransferase [Thermoanaerobaculia bacterium]
MRTLVGFAFTSALILLPLSLQAASTPAPLGTGGAVSSGDSRATKVGIEILRTGGNAVDAAVATALALAVVYPEAGNLGGGGFAVIKRGDKLSSLDFREVGPAAAKRDMYLDPRGEPIAEASQVGPLATGVPGSPAGLYEIHRKHGHLPWKRIVEPARKLAADGFRVDRHLNELLARDSYSKRLQRFPETAKVWFPHGKPVEVGSVVRLPALAATLAAYAERGPEAITTGPVAAAIEAASRRHGGVLTAADLAAYQPVWREPVVVEAFGWRFASMPLPSSGGLLLAETLGILERLEWAKMPRFGADRAHFLTETFRRVYADRFLLGDPSTTKAAAAQLLDPVWLEQRTSGIAPRQATPSTEVKPWPGNDVPAEGTETTHLSVVDGDGIVVSLTTTLNDLFGCAVFVPEIGFLNNEMDDFSTAPGRPNLFGLVQGEANVVAPGKRMLSSMMPTIAWKGKELVAIGGRGGSRIPTNTIQVLLNLIADGDSLQTALDRPRLHHQWLPDRMEVEADTLSPETRAELERRGHDVFIADSITQTAKIHAIRVRADGLMEAASDPRSTGLGAVVKPEP